MRHLTILLLILTFSFKCSSNTYLPDIPDKKTSIKEMLINGPWPIKLHSLAMITQGKINDDLDNSYLPAFEVCSQESSIPIRLTTAKILGKYYVEDKKIIHPKVIELLIKLAKDENIHVRKASIFEGLKKIKNNSNQEIINIISDADKNIEYE